MKQPIIDVIDQAVSTLQEKNVLPRDTHTRIELERTRQSSHGDFACNLALVLAKSVKLPPRELASRLVDALPDNTLIARTEIAGPGFINFFLHPSVYHAEVRTLLEQGKSYGQCGLGAGLSIHLEYVSANPTGPLHVGHGRGAAYGASLANVLKAAGYRVHSEYYVNDAGRQMEILATSVWLRYLDLCGESFPFPVNGYQGDYVWDIAATLHRENANAFHHSLHEVFADIPKDEPGGGDKEAHIDALIARVKSLLGGEAYRKVFDLGLNALRDDICRDLEEFDVHYDEWFSERSLVDSGALQTGIDRLKATGHTYEKGGALWFRSMDFGDEKDRVVLRDNGQPTYFASDIAYHVNKLDRGYHQLIDIWGADHHGYVPRVKAVLSALEEDAHKLDVLLVQFAVLYRGGKKVQMSTRSGDFVTLRELRQEVGADAARFFYVMRKSEQHMDFDLDLAKSQSNDNPVYYIQYAHARVCSVFRQLQEKGLSHELDDGNRNLHLLNENHEQELMVMLSRYPEMIESAARNHEPHLIAHYLRDLANAFHTYYNAHTFITDDAAVRNARLSLIAATRQVIANGLALLGVSAPSNM
ncbi:MAG: arginine--tRNA ligase [Gammaproteobacteria bacterium]|nr:MAG: arginine--tRNA ligase [Gammaproteobacteria bacterium]